MQEMEDDVEDMDTDDSDRVSGDSDSEDDIVSKIRKERGLEVRDKKQISTSIRSGARTNTKKRGPEMRMGTVGGRMTGKNDSKKSFGSRLQSEDSRRKSEGHRMSRTAMGGMEMSFTPQSSKKKGGNSKDNKNKNKRRA
jgi:ribosome biogenesis protein ENP2